MVVRLRLIPPKHKYNCWTQYNIYSKCIQNYMNVFSRSNSLRSSSVNVNQSLATSFSFNFSIHSFNTSSACSDCQLIFIPTVFLRMDFFSLAKYFSIGAISGIYGGIKVSLQSQFLANATIFLLLWVVALSRIIRVLFNHMFHSSSINRLRLFKNFRNNDEFNEPLVFIANTFPDDEIAVIKEVELLNPILFSSLALPFFDREYIVLVALEKDDSSTFIKISYWESRGIMLIAK